MNIKFDHTNHKKLWNWLADNPDKNKKDWPEWTFNGGDVCEVSDGCFACDYREAYEELAYACEEGLYSGGKSSCNSCPLKWPKDASGQLRCRHGGLWTLWLSADNSVTRSKYALQIANLPVKDGVETI